VVAPTLVRIARSFRSLACSFRRSFELFCTAPKNRHIISQTSNDLISSMWWPLRGVRRPMWLPLSVFEGSQPPPSGVRTARSLRSLACSFRHRFVPFCPAPKNRHIISRTSNARSSIQHPFPPLYHNTIQPSRSLLLHLQRTATYSVIST